MSQKRTWGPIRGGKGAKEDVKELIFNFQSKTNFKVSDSQEHLLIAASFSSLTIPS